MRKGEKGTRTVRKNVRQIPRPSLRTAALFIDRLKKENSRPKEGGSRNGGMAARATPIGRRRKSSEGPIRVKQIAAISCVQRSPVCIEHTQSWSGGSEVGSSRNATDMADRPLPATDMANLGTFVSRAQGAAALVGCMGNKSRPLGPRARLDTARAANLMAAGSTPLRANLGSIPKQDAFRVQFKMTNGPTLAPVNVGANTPFPRKVLGRKLPGRAKSALAK